MSADPDTSALTTPPTAATAKAVQKQVQFEGGVAHDHTHTDREVTMNLPGLINKATLKPTAVPLCTCGRPLVVTFPQSPAEASFLGSATQPREPVRACIECDALDQMPRFNGSNYEEAA